MKHEGFLRGREPIYFLCTGRPYPVEPWTKIPEALSREDRLPRAQTNMRPHGSNIATSHTAAESRVSSDKTFKDPKYYPTQPCQIIGSTVSSDMPVGRSDCC